MYDELVKELRDSAEWADRLALMMGRAEGDAHAPVMRKAANAIEKLSNPLWIPVTERLPEEYAVVLLLATTGEVIVGYYDSEYKIYCDMSGFRHMSTHWMLLPQPPKEGE